MKITNVWYKIKGFPEITCEGSCFWSGECEGEIKEVHVTSNDYDWGNFKYCQTAIRVDRDNGLLVEILED
jgi:hypothetical protein